MSNRTRRMAHNARMGRLLAKRKAIKRAYFAAWRAASLAAAAQQIDMIRSTPGDPKARAAAIARVIVGAIGANGKADHA